MKIISYMQQIKSIADKLGVRRLDLYRKAGVCDSTYYRHKAGTTELRYETAERIRKAADNG